MSTVSPVSRSHIHDAASILLGHASAKGRCVRRKIAYKHEILEPAFYTAIVKPHATQMYIEEYRSTE